MKKLIGLLALAFCLNGKAQIITTVAGNGVNAYSGDGGQATAAELYQPSKIAFDAAGNLYIVDHLNSRIRKVTTAGIITTVAGTYTNGYNGDGGQATAAELNQPFGIALDTAGNIYIADTENNRIRMITTAGVISTVAGSGTWSYSGDGGAASAAELKYPYGIAVDAAGNLYIADTYSHRIRKVTTAGIISTYAGNGTGAYAGDGGQATAAELYFPIGVTVDNVGNLYIADQANNAIRKVTTTGIITTVAGTGAGGFSGDGAASTAAELFDPSGIAFDGAGNLYIADGLNHRVRMVTTAGIISTVAGDGTNGYSGDGGAATAAELFQPYGVAFDAMGNLFIADQNNSRIRMVCFSSCTTGIEQYANNKEQVTIYPNPTSDQFFIDANTTDKLIIDLYDVNNRCVLSKNINNKTNIDVTGLSKGVYSLTIKTIDAVINKKLVIVH